MDIELIELSTVEKEEYRTISRYINYGGAGNSRNLLLHLANYFSAAGFSVAEAERPPWEGIYHPDFTGIPSLQEYLAQKYIPGRPTLGLWFYQSFWQSRNTLFIDSLIKEIEKQQANVIPVFTYSVKDVDLGTRGLEWVVENYFMDNGRPVIDMLISPLMFSLSMRVNKVPGGSEVLPEEEKGILKKLGVPVLKAIVTQNTCEKWRETPQGLSPMDITMSIAMPEFDGMLITVPVAARQLTESDPLTGAKIVRYSPIAEK
jgi:cobaltochelatase CobN